MRWDPAIVLGHFAVPDMNEPIHEFGFVHEGVVAGDEDGFTVILKPSQDLHQFKGTRRIQMGGRFVGDDDGRIVDQGPGDGNSLGFSAGKPLNPGMSLWTRHRKDREDAWLSLQERKLLPAGIGGEHHIFQDADPFHEVETAER